MCTEPRPAWPRHPQLVCSCTPTHGHARSVHAECGAANAVGGGGSLGFLPVLAQRGQSGPRTPGGLWRLGRTESVALTRPLPLGKRHTAPRASRAQPGVSPSPVPCPGPRGTSGGPAEDNCPHTPLAVLHGGPSLEPGRFQRPSSVAAWLGLHAPGPQVSLRTCPFHHMSPLLPAGPRGHWPHSRRGPVAHRTGNISREPARPLRSRRPGPRTICDSTGQLQERGASVGAARGDPAVGLAGPPAVRAGARAPDSQLRPLCLGAVAGLLVCGRLNPH